MGVWIETNSQSYKKMEQSVTPHVGVWIETERFVPFLNICVTPHVGVWIETVA